LRFILVCLAIALIPLVTPVFANASVSISIDAGRAIYSSGEAVIISGKILDSTDSIKPIGLVARVQIEIFDQVESIYRSSTISNEDGSFADRGFRAPRNGEFIIKAVTIENATAFTTIRSSPGFSLVSGPSALLTLSIPGALFLLLLMSVWPIRPFDANPLKDPFTKRFARLFGLRLPEFYIIQFLLLSILTTFPILSLVFFPRQIGSDAPIGLVMDQIEPSSSTGWVFNIGGIFDGVGYSGGLSIPVYVVVLGLLGAYLAYLRNLPMLINDVKSIKEISTMEERKFEILAHSMKTLTQFLLGPILAVGLWLILVQVGTNPDPPYSLAIASLTVGLLTERVIRFIVSQVSSILGEDKIVPNLVGLTREEGLQILAADGIKHELIEKSGKLRDGRFSEIESVHPREGSSITTSKPLVLLVKIQTPSNSSPKKRGANLT